MFYDDQFNPNDVNEPHYESNTSQKKTLNNYKLFNKRFHNVKRRQKTKTGMISVDLEYFSSGSIDSVITSATTGMKYNEYRVGGKEEDLFFKVGVANGETKTGPVNLFYDSPEQFEKHQNVTLANEIKKKWYDKYQKAKLIFL